MSRETDQNSAAISASTADFVRFNWKFVVVTTALLSVIAVIFIAALLPQQYSRQITLNVAPIPISLLENQPVVTSGEVGNLATSYLQEADLQEVSIIPNYNLRTQKLDVTLQSRSREALENSGARLVEIVEEQFQGTYEDSLDMALESRITSLELDVQAEREALELLEQRIARLSGGANSTNEGTATQVEGLETERAYSLAEIGRLETEINEMQQARDNPAAAGVEPIAANVISATEITQSRSLTPMIVLAVMLSFIMAVIAAIIRTALRHAK